MTTFEKIRIHLRGYCLGKSWFKALALLEYAGAIHSGFRKDNVTPEFQHQLEIANYVLTLDSCDENLLIGAICHDLMEDYGKDILTNQRDLIDDVTFYFISLLNKNDYDSYEQWYSKIGKNYKSAIIKGVDRINNISTMVGAFNPEKMRSYIAETEEYVLPMLKTARRTFPEHTMKFFNVETNIKIQIKIYKHFLEQMK